MFQAGKNQLVSEKPLAPILGENFFSFFSRLAARKWVSASDLASAVGFGWRDFVRIDSADLHSLAPYLELSTAQVDALIAWTPMRHDRNWCRLRGEYFPVRSVKAPHTRVCLECLRENLEGGQDPTNLYFDGAWDIREVSLCLKHNVLLEAVSTAKRPAFKYNYSSYWRDILRAVETRVSTSMVPTAYDLWLDGRLRGEPDASWLGSKSLYAVAKFSEELGGQLLGVKGADKKSSSLSIQLARNHGFEIVREGANAILIALDSLAVKSVSQRQAFGILTNMGDLTDFSRWQFQPFIDLLRASIEAHWEQNAGDVVLGEVIERKEYYSTLRLSELYEVECPTIRTFALKNGVLPVRDHQKYSRQLFAACDVKRLPPPRPDLVSGDQVYKMLRVKLPQFDSLVREGVLPRAQPSEVRNRCWSADCVENLLKQLKANSQIIEEREFRQWRPLTTMPPPLKASLGEILTDVFANKIRLGRRGEELLSLADLSLHYAEAMLWSTERRRMKFRPGQGETALLPLQAAARQIGLQKDDTLKRLILAGGLPGCAVKTYASGRAVGYMNLEQISDFKSKYLTLALARDEFGLSYQRLTRLIASSVLQPLTIGGDLFANVWKRSELIQLIEEYQAFQLQSDGAG